MMRVLFCGAVVIPLIGARMLLAGPLNPPAGPVAPSMKTLDEVEARTAINSINTPGDADSLYKITQPGSYYLTGNISGVAGKHGIEIAASGVTIDLNGFDLVGVPSSLDGVSATLSNLDNIVVRNGSVRDWGDEGVDLGTFSSINCRVEGVLSSGNAGNGIMPGSGSSVADSAASSNLGHGISTGSGCAVSNCTAYFNGDNGIVASSGSTVADCTARINTNNGIVCVSSSVIRANTCSSNGNGGDGAGIHVTGSDNRIEGNNCTGADRGIDVDSNGNIIIRNTCTGNATNWTIVAGNAYGPIVATPSGAAVNGSTAAAALGSTDPNANFSY